MSEENSNPRIKGKVSIGTAGSALILIAFFSIGCFLLEMRTPRYFTWDDNATHLLPAFIYDWRTLMESGEIPHINFHQLLGVNYLRFSQTAIFYPPAYLSAFLSRIISPDFSWAIDIYVIIHLLASAIFFFILVNKTMSPPHALMLALLWITTPFIIFLPRSWGTVSVLFAFMPISFLVLDSLLKKPSTRTIAIFSATKTLFFFAGHSDWFFRLTFFEVLYVFFFHPHTVKTQTVSFYKRLISYIKTLLPFFSAYALVILLSAPLLVPSIAAKYESAFRADILPVHEFLNLRIGPVPFFCSQIGYFMPGTVFGSNSCIYFVGPFFLALLVSIFFRLCWSTQGQPQWRWLALAMAGLLFSTIACAVLYFAPKFSNAGHTIMQLSMGAMRLQDTTPWSQNFTTGSL
jgi:hypothetical protein